MTRDGTITVVPSVHFSATHRRRVRDTIRDRQPDLVAVELGEQRFERLERVTDPSEEFLADLAPPAAAAYHVLRAIQRTVVKLYGLDQETTDMETAIETASELDIDVALVDDPISETFTALAGAVNPITLPRSFLRAQVMSPEERLEQLELLTLPFDEIEDGDDVQPLLDHVRRLFPELATVLVDQRDRAMAARLHALRRDGYDVVAVVGAAHHNGIDRHLAEFEDLDETLDGRAVELDAQDDDLATAEDDLVERADGLDVRDGDTDVGDDDHDLRDGDIDVQKGDHDVRNGPRDERVFGLDEPVPIRTPSRDVTRIPIS